MNTWKDSVRAALVVGSTAGLTSLAALVVCGRLDRAAWASVNAPSHWLWGDEALRERRPTARHSATGVLIHHLSAVFWGFVHERYIDPPDPAHPVRPPARGLAKAAVTTTVAAVVDLCVVPERLTPGFQKHLSPASLIGVYTAFGLGLVVGGEVADRFRACSAGTSNAGGWRPFSRRDQ